MMPPDRVFIVTAGSHRWYGTTEKFLEYRINWYLKKSYAVDFQVWELAPGATQWKKWNSAEIAWFLQNKVFPPNEFVNDVF